MSELSPSRPRKRLVIGAVGLSVGVPIGLMAFLPGPIDLPLGATIAPPILSDPNMVRFVAVGDVGKDNPGARAVGEAVALVCQERGCDFGLLLGDNLYQRGMESADDPRMDTWVGERFGAAGVPWYLVLGNHDYGGALDEEVAHWQIDWAARTEGFELPATAYTFTAGPAAFVAIDTTRVFWNGGVSHSPWLETTLSRPKSSWTVGFGHHPIRSNGHHGNAGEYEGSSLLPYASGRAIAHLAERIVCPEFDLWFAGHEHNLQWIEHCDTQFLISGSGGSLTAIEDRGNEPIFAKAEMGFVWVQLDSNEARIVFVDRNGDVLHEGSIAR